MYPREPGAVEDGVVLLRDALRQEQQAIRGEKRSSLLRNKRVRLDDVEKTLQEISTEKLCELAVILRKLKADVACLKEIKKATCVEHNIETFMSVNGVLPALVGLLTGKDPDKQVEAAACIINLTCGSHRTTYRIARCIGVYLIIFIQSSSYVLQDHCAWAAGNIVNDCQDCFSHLKAQGLLPALVGLLQSTFPEVIQSAVYSLHACMKYQDSLSDLMQLSLPQHILSIFTIADLSRDALVDTAFILCNICSQITVKEKCEISRVGNVVLQRLHKVTKEDAIDVSIATPLIRCLGYLSCGSDALCEILCSHPSLNSCIRKVMHSKFHHLKKELFWVLTNILVSSKSSRCPFDVSPILDGIHVFLSPLGSDIIQALYFLCALVQTKPETKEVIRNKGLLTHVEALMSCGNEDVKCTAHVFHTLITS